MNNNEIIKFQESFLKQVDNLTEKKLQKYNFLSPGVTYGIVDSINDAYSANIILAGTTTPQRIPTNPNIQFVENEQVIVWYLNRDPRNKYVIAKCATGTEQTGGGSSGLEHDSATVLDSNTIDFSISGQQITGSVKTQQSITSDTNGIKLSGDSASPGNSKYYGTNDSGTKGYHGLPTIPTNTSDLTNDSGFITSAQAPVQSVAGKTGIVTLSKSDVGLGDVENKSSATIRGEITSSNVTTALGFTPENIANKGVVNGYASLDSNGKIPLSQIPDATFNTYTYYQITPSDNWVIKHNLNRRPSVTIVDSSGNVVVGEVKYIDNNTINISLVGVFAGTAYLN